MNDPRDPVLGRGRALGHDLIHVFTTPAGQVALCECGERFWRTHELAAVADWGDHVDEEIANRGTP